MKILRKRYVLIIFLILLALFVGYTRIKVRGKSSSLKLNLKTAKTASVQRSDIVKYLTLAGKLDAQNFVILQFQTSGKIAWVGVKEGDTVKKWQAIASLDKTELEKRFKKTMNDYLTNRWNFEDTQDQYKKTKEDFLITDEIKRILERKQFSLENAVLDVELADLVVKYATLVSPINGIVTGLDQPIAGVNIIPSNATFTIIDPSFLYLKSDVDEEDVTKIKLNQPTTIILDSYPDQKIESAISFISFTPVQGETSTVYRVKFNLKVENKDFKYRIGMNGDAKIKLDEAKNVLVIPIEAVYEEKEEKFVYLRNTKGKIEKRVIKTGLESDTEIEITEGLKEGDTVIY